jgi:signal transduction histidine kinase/Na+/proline symporter
MWLSGNVVAAVALAYLGLLFAVAYMAERSKRNGRGWVNNPLVYSLSIAVYCTSWTYYGSVGLAATSGMQFFAVYIGPTLIAFSWWILLRRIVRVTRRNNINSVADFIAFRYGNSVRIGALVAVMLLVGITPYIGLQLKAVSSTFELLSSWAGGAAVTASVEHLHFGFLDTGLLVALVLGVFGGMFGAGPLGPAERHEGMVAAVAVESVVKLVAFMAAGAYVTWGVFDGFTDIFTRIHAMPKFNHLLTFPNEGPSGYVAWFSLAVLSMMSVMLLPRQFHVMVVENTSERHITDAMWLFPLYLFLINLFVLPLAFGGLLLFGNSNSADSFVLMIPLLNSKPLLGLLVFIGGLSAATGMVIVSSVALSTILMNNLVMPFLLTFSGKLDLSVVLLHIKRAAIIAILLMGYLYYNVLGESLMLVNMGLISFGAATQLAPALFGGLFWRQATAKGAAVSLTLGFAIWGYMFLFPQLCVAGWFSVDNLSAGPFGLALLRPTAFMGLEGLDIWSHGLFWTFLLNCGGYVLVSLLSSPSRAEIEQVARLVFAERATGAAGGEHSFTNLPNIGEFEDLLAKFIGAKKSRQRIRQFFGGKYNRDAPPLESVFVRLRVFVERQIGGVIGPAAANAVIDRYMSLEGSREEEILDVFGELSLSLEQSREELEHRVRELTLLLEASKRVVSTLDSATAVKEVMRLLGNAFGFPRQGAFFFKDGKLIPGPILGVRKSLVQQLSGEPQDNSAVGRAAKTGKLQHADSGVLELKGLSSMESVLAAPIVSESEVMGVLFVIGSGEEEVFSKQFIATFEALSTELALALTNARLFGEVSDLNRNLEQKVRDRTASLRQANEELKELDRLKRQFIANMSHELRTPMNSILGYTQLILDGVDGPVTDEQRSSLGRVEKNANNLLGIINEILDLSRMEAGKLELDLRPVDLAELVRDICQDLRTLATPKGIELNCDAIGDNHSVNADPTRAQEIVFNLLGNAVKFTDKGSVDVTVEPLKFEGRPGVLVSVSDTGPGIARGELEEIFKAFKQIDGSITRPHGGTGLGLNIAKRLVEMHGGWIKGTSRVGHGSVFAFWLPVNGTVNEEADVAAPKKKRR